LKVQTATLTSKENENMKNDQNQKSKTTYDLLFEELAREQQRIYCWSYIYHDGNDPNIKPILDRLRAKITLTLQGNQIISMDELIQLVYDQWSPWVRRERDETVLKREVGRAMVFEVVRELLDVGPTPYIIMRDGKEVVAPVGRLSHADIADFRRAFLTRVTFPLDWCGPGSIKDMNEKISAFRACASEIRRYRKGKEPRVQ
jgi:hypothetical protein